MQFDDDLLERFVRYTAVDTMSDSSQIPGKHPSTDGQWDLLRMLYGELRGMGLEDVTLDDSGVVFGNIPGNLPADRAVPTIAFMAHVDTASDCNGNNVKARVICDYDGKDIELKPGLVLDVKGNPALLDYKGETIVVTDGTSLLGADDKAGVAEIMEAAKLLMENPSILHGPIQVIFTTDEETGCGMDYFPMDKLESVACYTMDGGMRYVIETECFNAASVNLRFEGISAHLGSAKNRMVNAVTMASAFVSALPQAESPEATDGRDGYYCPYSLSGSTESVELKLLLRDFDYEGLMHRIEVVRNLAETIKKLHRGGKVSFESSISYRNMQEACDRNPKALELLFEAGKRLGMKLTTEVIRGGTDGARLAERGIPCPNLFTGGSNYHSLKEWAALPGMRDAVKLILQTISCWAELG